MATDPQQPREVWLVYNVKTGHIVQAYPKREYAESVANAPTDSLFPEGQYQVFRYVLPDADTQLLRAALERCVAKAREATEHIVSICGILEEPEPSHKKDGAIEGLVSKAFHALQSALDAETVLKERTDVE